MLIGVVFGVGAAEVAEKVIKVGCAGEGEGRAPYGVVLFEVGRFKEVVFGGAGFGGGFGGLIWWRHNDLSFFVDIVSSFLLSLLLLSLCVVVSLYLDHHSHSIRWRTLRGSIYIESARSIMILSYLLMMIFIFNRKAYQRQKLRLLLALFFGFSLNVRGKGGSNSMFAVLLYGVSFDSYV